MRNKLLFPGIAIDPPERLGSGIKGFNPHNDMKIEGWNHKLSFFPAFIIAALLDISFNTLSVYVNEEEKNEVKKLKKK